MGAGPLLLLNGPPGIGTSTVAQRMCSGRPLSLCSDIDLFRRSLGRWADHPERSGELARVLALAVAERHLLSGHGVVVPQFLGRLSFVERLEELAHDVGAPFHHVVLMDDERTATSRFFNRVQAPEVTAQHREAAAMAGGEAGYAEMYRALLAVVEARDVAVVPSTEGDIAGTVALVQAAVAGRW